MACDEALERPEDKPRRKPEEHGKARKDSFSERGKVTDCTRRLARTQRA
ncbi:hypothetical protein X777_11182 [Ooceraea biroi]|uniref:Uncharacterized protein n=1 Tax=Ooceraea biroi TaxID=2015173 RepID=A0A026W440_OOCBI|nr:hypothetical protein X777_11182 [Ooceraea biroi]